MTKRRTPYPAMANRCILNLGVKAMTWQIKLKDGFFRTVPCEMSLVSNQMRLAPVDPQKEVLVELSDHDIISICLNQRQEPFPEIEIQTRKGVLIAFMMNLEDKEPLIQALYGAYRSRFLVV
jgi:hypothetical protein